MEKGLLRNERAATLLAGAVLLAAVFLVFGRGLPYDFVYDDRWTVVQNPALRHLRPLGRFFSQADTAAHPESGMARDIYRPLPTLTFAADLRLWSLRPWAFRLENLLLHGLNAFLVLLLLRRMGLSPPAAALGAGVFLAHPAQAESVVWVTQRSNLLCLAGMLLALLGLGEGAPRRGKTARAAGVLAFAAALLSKETAVVFPGLLLLWDARQDGGGLLKKDFWKKKAPLYGLLAALVLAYLALRYGALGRWAQRDFRAGGWLGNLLVGALSWWEYVKIVLRPVDLTVSHRQYVDVPWQSPWPWVGLALFAAQAWLAARLWRRRATLPAYALAWPLLTLLPVLGVVPAVTFVAERFLYAPLAGVGLLAGWTWDRVPTWSGRRRNGTALWRGTLCLWLLLLATGAFRRTGVWKNEVTLWESAVAQDPQNAFARVCLAQAYAGKKEYGRAEEEYRAALDRSPSLDTAFAALNNLAELRNRQGRPEQSLAWSEKALSLRPGAPAALYNRVVSLALLGKTRDALAALEEARDRHPDRPEWAALRERVLSRRKVP